MVMWAVDRFGRFGLIDRYLYETLVKTDQV